MEDDQKKGIMVLGFESVQPRPDGSLRRNSYMFNVEVDGILYRVPMRRRNYAVHIPHELMGHPKAADIKAACEDALLEYARKRLPALREARAARKLMPGGK